MPNVQTIYRQSILPLPDDDKLRLASIILQDLSGDLASRTTALDLLQSLSEDRVFNSAEEVDEHILSERESWDNYASPPVPESISIPRR